MTATATDHIYTLRRTPFALAPLIHAFYDQWEGTEKDILLSYLILPLITYSPIHTFLTRAKKNSSIRTLMQEQSRVVGLELRVEEFKPITHAALLILSSEQCIEINEDMSVSAFGKIREENADETLLKLARKLAVVFSGDDVVSIYRLLGFKAL